MDRRAAAVATLIAALAALSSLAQPAGSARLWAGDYETGDFRQWRAVQGPAANAAIVSNVVRQGRHAARFTVGPGDKLEGASGERSEVYAPTGEGAGTESWWAWSAYFGEDFNPNPDTFWNIFTQWHATGPGQSNVHFEINTSRTPWKVQLRSFGGQPDQNERRFELADFRRDHWFDFVLHVRWAPDNTGFLEVWIDGQLVLPKTFTPTLYAGQGVYLKQGFYRGPSSLRTAVYLDGMRRGDSLEALAQEATKQPSFLAFVSRPRMLTRRTLALNARAPHGRRVRVIVRGPRGRMLASKWQRVRKRDRINAWLRLQGLRNQRFVRVTLLMPKGAGDHAPTRTTMMLRLRPR